MGTLGGKRGTQEVRVEYTNIRLEKENAVATIRLNRPDALNALSPDLLQEFSEAVAEVRDDQSNKALVVRGEGRAFCSGADLIAMEAAFADQNRLARYLELTNACLFQLEELPVPVIAAVHGFALAGGLELMLACDMAVAADGSRYAPCRAGGYDLSEGMVYTGWAKTDTKQMNRYAALEAAARRARRGMWRRD